MKQAQQDKCCHNSKALQRDSSYIWELARAGRPHLIQDVPEEVLRELGLVGDEDSGEEAVQQGMPGGGQLPHAAAVADVVEDLAHHAVQLLCGFVHLPQAGFE